MRYAVSYIDWVDYELIIEFHEATSAVEAMKMHSKINDCDIIRAIHTAEDFKRFCFDCDSMVHAEPIQYQTIGSNRLVHAKISVQRLSSEHRCIRPTSDSLGSETF